jgi:hypothetical protein
MRLRSCFEMARLFCNWAIALRRRGWTRVYRITASERGQSRHSPVRTPELDRPHLIACPYHHRRINTICEPLPIPLEIHEQPNLPRIFASFTTGPP